MSSFSKKPNKKREFYKKSKFYKENRKKWLLLGELCVIALLLLCVALISLNSHSTSKKAVSSENIQRAENASDLKDAERKNSSKNPLRLVISTVGDCTLGTDENFDYSTSLNSVYESNGKEYFFQNVRSVFEKDDLTIANAEGTFTTSTSREDKLFAFKADPEYAQIFSSSSVEAVTLANNHSHDYGEQSYEDTKTALDSAGVTHFGYDETAVLEIKGVKVGLVGIYELSDHMERTTQLKENIAKVKKDGAQLIITVFHWGTEKEISPDNNQTQLGRMAIDEGADLVVGHHPHVLQGIEKYKGKYIVYSLGNFCFGGNSYPSDMDTMIFQQTFTIDSSGVQPDGQIHVIPCSISSASGYNNYQPTPAQGSEAERILTKINERSQLIEGEGVILPLTE
ncbi:Bacterial capsule synthesis protein PGA_cap [Blautia hydrogenotrophica]|uniref:CapA family protein n=1 Tax=Blautia hydrogenotrophica TaxID=53443 RepID=UPI0006BFE0FB|nr:CapA family protein [Blautia hydrogenotrophica]CUM76021.1 Bacterial capsule synthesis protein PGA_cap [Blautia hydrogenotrophica]SCI33267.1 Bacterial capsule synthesis protein PGA_cap [uncultured Blautia sp.]